MEDILHGRDRGKRRVALLSPQWVSQDTCEAWGFGRRGFLRVAKTLPHTRIGKLVLVEASVLNEALRQLQTVPANDDAPAETSVVTPESVAARLGVQIDD